MTPAANIQSDWHDNSGIMQCSECDGYGVINKTPYLSTNDPDAWEEECAECEGHGYYACEVCGFDIEIDGYDCFVCDNLYNITDALLTPVTGEQIGHAVMTALANMQAKPLVEHARAA